MIGLQMAGKDKKIVKKKMLKTLKDKSMDRVAKQNHNKSKAATKKIKTSLKKVTFNLIYYLLRYLLK